MNILCRCTCKSCDTLYRGGKEFCSVSLMKSVSYGRHLISQTLVLNSLTQFKQGADACSIVLNKSSDLCSERRGIALCALQCVTNFRLIDGLTLQTLVMNSLGHNLRDGVKKVLGNPSIKERGGYPLIRKK